MKLLQNGHIMSYIPPRQSLQQPYLVGTFKKSLPANGGNILLFFTGKHERICLFVYLQKLCMAIPVGRWRWMCMDRWNGAEERMQIFQTLTWIKDLVAIMMKCLKDFNLNYPFSHSDGTENVLPPRVVTFQIWVFP